MNAASEPITRRAESAVQTACAAASRAYRSSDVGHQQRQIRQIRMLHDSVPSWQQRASNRRYKRPGREGSVALRERFRIRATAVDRSGSPRSAPAAAEQRYRPMGQGESLATRVSSAIVGSASG